MKVNKEMYQPVCRELWAGIEIVSAASTRKIWSMKPDICQSCGFPVTAETKGTNRDIVLTMTIASGVIRMANSPTIPWRSMSRKEGFWRWLRNIMRSAWRKHSRSWRSCLTSKGGKWAIFNSLPVVQLSWKSKGDRAIINFRVIYAIFEKLRCFNASMNQQKW